MNQEDLNIVVLNEKIDLLKSELEENKLYLELCFVALLIIIFGYFKTELGKAAIGAQTPVGVVMIVIVMGLYIGIVYFFYSVISINSKNKKLIKEKIDFLSNQ